MTRAASGAWWRAGAVCLAVLAADQASKAVVEHDLVVGEKVDAVGPLKLTLAHNEGIAFGLAGGSGAPLVVFTLIGLGVVLYLFAREPGRPLMWLAAGLLAGGALGNLTDRVRHGSVTDFVDLPHWPPFNLADSAITCGVLILAFIYLREAQRVPDGT
ncbi:MAG TPA: signal peptidase II [Solirubrobacterales bacterium]|nr:signal peptidase II [Solirubrobacterales bacterium]